MGAPQIAAISPDAFINMPVDTLVAFTEPQIRALDSKQITQIEQSVAFKTGGEKLTLFKLRLQATKNQVQLAAAASNPIVNPSASDSNIFKPNIILFIACLIKSIAF